MGAKQAKVIGRSTHLAGTFAVDKARAGATARLERVHQRRVGVSRRGLREQRAPGAPCPGMRTVQARRCEASLGLQRAEQETRSQDQRPLHARASSLSVGSSRPKALWRFPPPPAAATRPALGPHVAGCQAGVIRNSTAAWMDGWTDRWRREGGRSLRDWLTRLWGWQGRDP